MPTFIIVGYGWRILGRWGQKAPPLSVSSPEKAHPELGEALKDQKFKSIYKIELNYFLIQ